MGVNIMTKGRPIPMPARHALPTKLVGKQTRSSFSIPQVIKFEVPSKKATNGEPNLEQEFVSQATVNSSQTLTTGVYYKNVELKSSVHPLQSSRNARNKKKQRNHPFTVLGRPLSPAPVFPRGVVQLDDTWAENLVKNKINSNISQDDEQKSLKRARNDAKAELEDQQRRAVRRRLESISNEEKLFLEATAALSTAGKESHVKAGLEAVA